MYYFDHEKLDVYKAAIEPVVLINSIVENLPRGRAYLADQLQRAGASIPLNIAEGAGEYSSNEKNNVPARISLHQYAPRPGNHDVRSVVAGEKSQSDRPV